MEPDRHLGRVDHIHTSVVEKLPWIRLADAHNLRILLTCSQHVANDLLTKDLLGEATLGQMGQRSLSFFGRSSCYRGQGMGSIAPGGDVDFCSYGRDGQEEERGREVVLRSAICCYP